MGGLFLHSHIQNFFTSIVNEMVIEREKTSVERNDFIDLLLEIKYLDAEEDPEIGDMFMAARFFFYIIFA